MHQIQLMKKEIAGLYVISILTFLLSACNDSDSTKQYYLKDQWKTSSGNFFHAKNKPKEVTEYFYAGENNISQNKLEKFGSYDQFIYDNCKPNQIIIIGCDANTSLGKAEHNFGIRKHTTA